MRGPVRPSGSPPSNAGNAMGSAAQSCGADLGPASDADVPLNPLPSPVLGVLPDADLWAFLDYTDPIEDPGMIAFQVAQLTVGMGELKRQIDELRETQRNERSQ